MHTVFALRCFVVVIQWLIFPYPSGLLHCHCGNLTIAPVPAKQPWWIWINTSCEFIMSDCITTTKQSTTKPCAYFLRYTVDWRGLLVFRVAWSGSITLVIQFQWNSPQRFQWNGPQRRLNLMVPNWKCMKDKLCTWCFQNHVIFHTYKPINGLFFVYLIHLCESMSKTHD